MPRALSAFTEDTEDMQQQPLAGPLQVERYYFDSHLFDGTTVRSELLRGLEVSARRRSGSACVCSSVSHPG